LKLQLFSDEPIYDDFEIVKLGDSLTFLAEQLGYDTLVVQKALAGKSPRDRAAELVKGTKLRAPKKDSQGKPVEPDIRQTLYEGGHKSVSADKDPMLELARIVDKEARDLRKILETQ